MLENGVSSVFSSWKLLVSYWLVSIGEDERIESRISRFRIGSNQKRETVLQSISRHRIGRKDFTNPIKAREKRPYWAAGNVPSTKGCDARTGCKAFDRPRFQIRRALDSRSPTVLAILINRQRLTIKYEQKYLRGVVSGVFLTR